MTSRRKGRAAKSLRFTRTEKAIMIAAALIFLAMYGFIALIATQRAADDAKARAAKPASTSEQTARPHPGDSAHKAHMDHAPTK